jgi:hypothetical protein
MLWRQNFSDAVYDGIACAPSTARAGEEPNNRGVALVITLLLLFLLSVMGLVAVLSTSSDLLINGYYNNYRGSFYAADSGLNISRQRLTSQILGAVPATPPAGPPMPATVLTSAPASVLTSYGSSYSSLNVGQAAKGWQEAFTVTNATLSQVLCTETGTTNPNPPVATPPACAIDAQGTSWQYIYGYSLTSVGRAQGSEQAAVTENGSIILNVSVSPASSNRSFAYYGAFIDNYPPCLGPLVPGTMTGPMFTNGAWGFMTGGSYIFTDPIGQHQANASYWVNWTCYQAATSSYTNSGQTVAPQFQAGFNLGQDAITPPPNSYSQKWAAVDGKGRGESNSNPNNTDLNTYMKNIAGTPYPTGGATSGVYLNYTTVSGTKTMVGGGLYVKGDAQVTLSTSGASAQVFTITTMTVDPVANTTVVRSGSTTLTLVGVPKDLSVSPPQPGTMIYVDGNITSLRGPGQGVAAVQDGAAITITALNDVNITGDVVYKTEPVTTTQNQVPGTPVDTPIPGNDKNQDIGIFTANGNIVLSSPYSNSNLQVDGSLAAIGGSCASSKCGFTVNGYINTFNNIGGQIQTNIFAANMNTQNTYYDRRYTSRAGFAPPWFPSTTITGTAATYTSPPILTVQRTQWVSSSGQ